MNIYNQFKDIQEFSNKLNDIQNKWKIPFIDFVNANAKANMAVFKAYKSLEHVRNLNKHFEHIGKLNKHLKSISL